MTETLEKGETLNTKGKTRGQSKSVSKNTRNKSNVKSDAKSMNPQARDLSIKSRKN